MKRWILVGLATALFAMSGIAVPLYQDLVLQQCGLSETDAVEKVTEYLIANDMKISGLTRPAVESVGSCQYRFDYVGESRVLSFSVMSTWLHGVKLGIWDESKHN
ncbi:MAG: hypothetical protein OXT49_09495 [Gammaproteobacteria bacterium]|nr:hypothetical protein [Gammaproteobacteria bacterium]